MSRKTLVSLLLGLAACARGPLAAPDADELILCGDREVFILDRKAGGRKVWSWIAADRPEIPENVRKQFGTTDDCKPVDGGSRILITSSGGGVALVERATGRALFWASVRNAHSAEILPGNRVLAASSYGKDGNRLVLFDLASPGKELAVCELYGAHGAVWDPEARRVWTLGEKELHAYELKDWEAGTPALSLSLRMDLPDAGGHDLRPVPGTRRLVVTTGKGVWTFDRERRVFEPHEPLGNMEGIKSVDIHPRTGRTAFVKAETSWWSSRVSFLKPEGEIRLPGERLYKARWNP